MHWVLILWCTSGRKLWLPQLTAKAELQVYSKAEGLALTSVASNKEGELKWYHFAIGATIASLLSSIVEALFRLARKGWVREVEEK